MTMPQPPRIPRATYRLQLNAGFTLHDALGIVPYLDTLGISHLYLSSFLKARAGSQHGYDIVDHNAFNPEIGDEDDLDRLVAALERRGMGIILDFVPNHMGIGGKDNAWWLDLLEWGLRSPYAQFFDIDWQPGRRDMRGKVLVPFLGDQYGVVLERGELVPRFDRGDGSISVWYWDHRLPIAPVDYPRLLGGLHPTIDEALRPVAEKGDARAAAAAVKQRLAALAARPEIAAAIDGALNKLAGTPSQPRSFRALDRLLERQHYRVAYWRVAGAEINYRRFFDINDLAGLRQESPQVFETTHALVFRLLAQRKIHGLRIDHIDGLFNPEQYCQRLQRRAQEITGAPLYLLVEKILAHHERIRRGWLISGTTGYEFMNEVNGLFVDQAKAELAETIYQGFIGFDIDFDREVCDAKKLVARKNMASELHVLGVQLGRLAASHWRSRDYTIDGLREALREVVAHFPIYRTYVTARRVPEQDKRYVAWAVAQARKGAPETTVYEFLQAVLDTSLARGRSPLYNRGAVLAFAMHVQQYTGPLMAKGFEDTALYRYNRLISLNEVGGEPRRFGFSPAAFHQICKARLRRHPHTMLATATHDSKRGEDVRSRIDVLSEMLDEWRGRLQRWQRINHSFKREVDGCEAPERNDEYFLYQTMVGAWPMDGVAADDFVERLAAATLKAIREAKRRTNWNDPNEAYEQATQDFVRRILETDRRNPFLDEFVPFQERVARIGMVNGLAQTLLKLTVPGVPDIYQGCELWQLAMVDPDNRRPVDYDERRRLLDRALTAAPAELLPDWRDGALKLAVVQRTLALRRERPELFDEGTYLPLAVRGEKAQHLVAFARRHDDTAAIVVVPRLIARLWPEGSPLPPLAGAWRGTFVEAPPGMEKARFVDILAGDAVAPTPRRGGLQLPAEHLFARLPLALLSASASSALIESA